MRRPLALAPAVPALAAEDGRVGVASVTTFANDAGIAIDDGGPAAPYPSAIEVAGGIADLDVRLRGLDQHFPHDVDVLLVGPRGQTAVVMSDAGGKANAFEPWRHVDRLPDRAPIRRLRPDEYPQPARVRPRLERKGATGAPSPGLRTRRQGEEWATSTDAG